MDKVILKIIEVVQPDLQKDESIVSIRLAQPLSMSHADYFTRYKVKIGKIDGSATSVSNVRCIVVQFSSNKQIASINYDTNCESIGEIKL